MTKYNAYPSAEADRYRNQVGYSRFSSGKDRELTNALFLASAGLVQGG